MTIAAGFMFDKGILLCADTQETYSGVMKLQASKIFPADFAAKGGTKVAFALTGDVAYARRAVEL